MGCDIHMFVEYKTVVDGVEKWCCGDYFKKDRYDNNYSVVPIYDGRNYALFSLLADVRNYGDNKPISEPKGLPEDCCQEIKDQYEYWYGDAHSTSYFTLKELIDYQNKQTPTKYSGMISPQQQKDLDNGILPTSWCQGTNMEGFERREWEEYDNLLEPIVIKLKERISEILWLYSEESVLQYVDKVRTVFWFDN